MKKRLDQEGELLLLLFLLLEVGDAVEVDGTIKGAFEAVIEFGDVLATVSVSVFAIAVAIVVVVVAMVLAVAIVVAMAAAAIAFGFGGFAIAIATVFPRVVPGEAVEEVGKVVTVHLSVQQQQQEVAFFLQSTFPSENSYPVVSKRAYLKMNSKMLCLEQIGPYSECSHLDAGVSKVWASECSHWQTAERLYWLLVFGPYDRNTG